MTRRVLVVHDCAELRTVFRRVLERRGHLFFEASSGSEARTAVTGWPSSQPLVDAALVDVGLPEGRDHGLVLARWLRDRIPGIDVALVSGQVTSELYARARELGCELYETGTPELAHDVIDAITGPESSGRLTVP